MLPSLRSPFGRSDPFASSVPCGFNPETISLSSIHLFRCIVSLTGLALLRTMTRQAPLRLSHPFGCFAFLSPLASSFPYCFVFFVRFSRCGLPPASLKAGSSPNPENDTGTKVRSKTFYSLFYYLKLRFSSASRLPLPFAPSTSGSCLPVSSSTFSLERR